MCRVVIVAGKDECGDEASDFEEVVEDLLDGGDVLNTRVLGGNLGVGQNAEFGGEELADGVEARVEGVAEGVGWNLGLGSRFRIGHCDFELERGEGK